MAFAIFYNDVDMANVHSIYTKRNQLTASQADKTLFLSYWGGGLKDWQTAPIAQSPYEQYIPTNTARRVVISYGTLEEFRTLLYRLINDNWADLSILKGVVDDMGRNCGGVDPWPVV